MAQEGKAHPASTQTTAAPTSAVPAAFDNQKMAQDIANSTQGKALGTVTCPPNEPVKKGTTFECAAGQLGIEIVVTTDSGDYTWTPAQANVPNTPPPLPHLTATQVTVLATPYDSSEVDGGTDYDTEVGFLVKNPTKSIDLTASYRVTVYSGATRVGTTDGGDDAHVLPGENKGVAVNVDITPNRKPDRAVVTFYQPDVSDVPTADPKDWEMSHDNYNCDSGTVQCDATMNLTYQPATGAGDFTQMTVLLMGKANAIVGAGVMTPANDLESTVRARETIPLNGQMDCPTCANGTIDWDTLATAYSVDGG